MNIKEIARRAGVSSATISRVLNNSGYVKEETRQKVLKAVEEYNYVPSAIARSLSIQDSLSVGTIIPDIENEFFSKVISGISEVAETYPYNIEMCIRDSSRSGAGGHHAGRGPGMGHHDRHCVRYLCHDSGRPHMGNHLRK